MRPSNRKTGSPQRRKGYRHPACECATDLLVDGKQVDAGHAWHRTIAFAATQAVKDVQVKAVFEALEDDLGCQAKKADGCSIELGVGRGCQKTGKGADSADGGVAQRKTHFGLVPLTSSAKALEWSSCVSTISFR